jgi:hypothetical protein
MIKSAEEFALIWKKETNELTQLNYFIFLLINELDSMLNKNYFDQKVSSDIFQLNAQQISDLVIQLGDGLQFFYNQMCFGNGCSLECPNKMDTPFSKKENKIKLEIIKREFDGNAKACASREDCLHHDLMSYVVTDTLSDYYTYDMNLETTEVEPAIINMATFILGIIIQFTKERGTELLKEPYKKADVMFN